MDIVVVGAGIAGLVAAHLFRVDGHAVTVVERDEDAHRTAGYRLHLDPTALAVLKRALPGHTFSALEYSGTGGEAFTHLVVLDEQGRTRLRIPRGDESLMIGRRPLRRILLRELDDAVRWGVHAARVSHDNDRASVYDQADRVIAEADLVVVADGTGSAIATDLVGRPTARPAGVVGIAGRTPLTPGTCPLIPNDLWKGPGFVVGPRATTAFLATHRPDANPTHTEVGPDLETPYLLWSLVLDGEDLPRSDLLRRTLAATTSWSDPLRDLVRRSDPDSVDAFVFYRPADLTGWPAGRVAVVGDAAHPIPPTAGIGASIAIADVGDLADALGASGDPTTAAEAMQQPMLRRAAQAQRSSSRVLTARSVLRREALRRPVLGAVLPMIDRAIRLQTSKRD